jgi:glucose/arabinose dehydrogenase
MKVSSSTSVSFYGSFSGIRFVTELQSSACKKFAHFLLSTFLLVGLAGASQNVFAQPTMLDPNLSVRTVVSGLTQPINMAFLGENDFFVLEKGTGQVKRVVNGTVQSTVLDLAVNSGSERGLLGIALHPNFPNNPGVYLYWTCQAPPPPAGTFFPTQTECPDIPDTTSPDTTNITSVPLLGNRVDRFIWDGSTLTFDRNIIKLRVFQADGAPFPLNQGDQAQNPAGNHNGGVIKFGYDGNLYIIVGDVGRRGQTQNLFEGPTGIVNDIFSTDDQFGGPHTENPHLTGVILRLNDDGTIPMSNPFYFLGGMIGGEIGTNMQKIFAYGIRNSFGMDFDPISGALWDQQNGDDTFDELNRIPSGANLGWVQVMGPLSRMAEFKAIETTQFGLTLQQLRWSPTRLANSPGEAFSRLVQFPGSTYTDPQFSWKYSLSPGGIGFNRGNGLGPHYTNDLFVGAARANFENGFLFRFRLTEDRQSLRIDDPRATDLVADNTSKTDITESEEFLIGRNFGIGTDIKTGPNGNLYVVSLSNGSVYEIYSNPGQPSENGEEK